MYRLNRRFRFFAVLFPAVLLAAFVTGCIQKPASEAMAPPVPAEELKNLTRLNETADAVYRKTTDGDYIDARMKLRELGAQLLGMHFNGLTSVEGLEALSAAVAQALRTFNAVQLQPDNALFAAARVRLSVDALQPGKDPMWLQYYKVIQDDIGVLNRSVQMKTLADFPQSLENYRRHYDTIRPALAVTKQPSEVEKADSLLKAIETQLSVKEPNPRILVNLLRHLEETIDALFGKKDTNTAYLPLTDPNQPIYWTFAIAAMILAALGYTGWRMFHSEKRLTPFKFKKDRES